MLLLAAVLSMADAFGSPPTLCRPHAVVVRPALHSTSFAVRSASSAAAARAPCPAMRQLGGGGPGFNPNSLVGPIIFASLVASGALGWLFNGILFISLIPLFLGPLVSWYLESNLISGTCPECSAPAQTLKGQQGQCFSCGATFSSEKGAGSDVFLRTAGSQPSGPFGGSPFGRSSSEDGVVEVEVITDDDYKK